MEITKFEHACLVIQVESRRLVIDPGTFANTLGDIDDVNVIVITHEHADHWTPERLSRLKQTNPRARIFGPEGLVLAAKDFPIEVVKNGDSIDVEPFTLKFFGSQHAIIHESMPTVDNVGVLVNDEIYFPGDAFTTPTGVSVGTLAVPSGGPWLKVGDVMDFVAEVAPRCCFPVHEMLLSDVGKSYVNNQLNLIMERLGGDFIALQPGDSYSIEPS